MWYSTDVLNCATLEFCCCCCSVTKLCSALGNPRDCSIPGFPVLHCLPELAQVHVLRIGDAQTISSPVTLLLLLPLILPSIRVFSNELAHHIRWPKYLSFSFSISPSNKYSGLISFKIDWFDLLAVQGTLKSLLQHNNSKALILQYSALFMANSHIHI